ncbi:unnamed protein product, partial [Rotaria sordida]
SPYGKPVDIWACGCIMAELTTGQALFAGESDIDQLYRIQKCLGPLPAKYMEAMKTNPKFDGLKFPPIHQLETLERRYGHLFPPDIMHLFKGALRLFAADRLTAEACIQHEAFVYLNQKQQHQQKRLQRQQHRPKTVLASTSTSQGQHDHNNEMVHFAIPFVDSRLRGLLTLLTPLSARVHIRLLIAVRFLTGIIPPSERRTVPSGAQTGGIFGIITTTSLVSIMIGEHFLGGWPSTFNVFDVFSCLWFLG